MTLGNMRHLGVREEDRIDAAAPARQRGVSSGQLERSPAASQHHQRVHSTAQPSFQARAYFAGPSSLLPIRRIQMLWRGTRPLTSA